MSLTYRELNAASDRVAQALRRRGFGPGAYVPLLAGRSVDFVVGIVGIAKSGAAYVPIDDSHPPRRQAQLIAECGARLALATSAASAVAPPGCEVVPLAALAADAGGATPAPAPDAAVYVIFTSGTTGVPKGVVIEHHALASIVAWHNRRLEVDARGATTLMAGIGFDVAQLELWSALTAGAALHLPDEATRRDPAALLDFIARRRLTHAFVPTALVAELVQLPQPAGLALRYLFTAGEKLGAIATRGLPYTVLDYYGPTEATIFATCNRVESEATPAIGRPVANVTIDILDARLEPVPSGEVGEICIGGDTLARGYLNDLALTAARFVMHPRRRARLYRSGDRGRWLPDGRLQFLGRLDEQVKIRGHRVEPGEVAEAMARQPGVRRAVVLATSGADDRQQLLAFFVADGAADGVADIARLRAALREILPDYMIPAAFLQVERIPLTANGKTDGEALLRLHAARATPAPLGDGDVGAIAAVWRELLGHADFGLHDRFFDVGGHSLVAARLMHAVGERLAVPTWVRDIYDGPTVAELAALVAARRSTAAPALDAEPIRALQDDVWLPEGLAFDFAAGARGLADPRHILLTGVTGFVGVHLLIDLLASTRAHIHCPVRAARDANLERRLDEVLRGYDLALAARDRSRVHLYPADLAEPRLGLEPSAYAALAADVDVIYHSASAVNFIEPYSHMRRDNVEGLREIVRFAAARRTKPLMLLSTVSVYSWGHLFTGKRVMHEDDDLDQNLPAVITDIAYSRSKWVMEKIADLAARRGLPLATFRIGYATFHSRTGACANYQWWSRLVKTCVQYNAVPDLDELREGLTTVDYLTAAITHISRQPEALGKKLNLVHRAETSLTLKAFFALLSACFGWRFRVLPFSEWRALWEQDSDAPLYPLLTLFRDHMYDGQSTVELYQHTYLWDNANVQRFLAGSGIEEPRFTRPPLEAYLRYLRIPLPHA